MPFLLRLRFWPLYFLLGYLTLHYVDARALIEQPVRMHINHALAGLGYKDPQYDITEITFSRMVAKNIQLEKDAISTIDEITAEYSLLDLVFGHAEKIVVTHPDIIYSAEDHPGMTILSGKGAFSLRDIPADELIVKDLNISFASEDFNPSIAGDINVIKKGAGHHATFHFDGEQKDMVLSFKGTITQDKSNTMTVDIDMPQARIDIPGFMMSRANGKLNLTYTPDHPLSAKGELNAGGMRVGNLPLDGIGIVISGQKPDFSLIGNAGITGVPMTNLSLRVSEDKKGAQALLQLSGDHPAALAKVFKLDHLAFPETQKFALTADIKKDTLLSLFAAPHQGGIFLYGDDVTPAATMTFSCDKKTPGCLINLPRAMYTASTINQFFSLALADNGLSMDNGTIELAGRYGPVFGETPGALAAEGIIRQMDMNIRSLPLQSAQFSFTRRENGDTTFMDILAGTLGGTITAKNITMPANHNGTGTLVLNNIHLDELSDFAQVKNLTVTGVANATIPLTFTTNGDILFDQTAKLSARNGVIKYAPKSYPSFLSGKTMKTLQSALKNYTYSQFDLSFLGTPKNVTAKFAGTGKNEDLFGDRAVRMDLKMNGGLPGNIRRVFPYKEP